MDARPGRTLTVNGVTADFGGETLRDRSGKAVVLRPQAFAVLRYLSENTERLVTKDELMEVVSPGVAVTDDSLVQCIHEIRRAIDDEAHAVLKTVPKRGYRFVPSATATGSIPTPPPGRSRPVVISRNRIILAIGALLLVGVAAAWWFLGRGEGLASSSGTSAIAVLPFDNLGGAPAQRYFADGIAEDLITDLSKISGIVVVARNSVWAYRDHPVDVRTVARELGVRYLLEGSVQWQGDKVRVNAQLIDALAGNHLWAERYDGPLDEIFAFHFQDKVIAKIVSALAVELTADEAAQAQRPETASREASDAVPLALHSGDQLVIQAKIARNADWLEFGFDSVWTMVGTKLLRFNPVDYSFVEIALETSGDIRPIVAGEGAVWISDIGSGMIIKVDPGTNQVVREIPAQMLYHQSKLGFGDGSIWVVTATGGFEKTLTRFNAATGAIEASIPLPSVGADALVAFGSVWVAGVDGDAVYRIDPKANAIADSIAVHSRPKLLCSGEGSVWVLNSTDGFVDRIDGKTGRITASINAGLVFPIDGDLACGGGYVWGHVAAFHDSDKAIPSLPLVQIDPKTNAVIRRYIGGKGFGWDLRYGAGSLWMTGSSLFRIQPPV